MTALLVIGCCQYATTEKKSDHTLVWSGYGGGLYYAARRCFNLSLLTILLTISLVMRIVWRLLLYGKRPSLQGLVGERPLSWACFW
ncbi:MAG: hypothetical protein R6X34_10455 [Chloroflexota bacterium]